MTPLGSAARGPSAAPLPSVAVSVGVHFPGISSSNSSCGCVPPDVQVAVGPSHVVEMVNAEGKIWNKTGHAISSFTLATFFLTSTDFISDPKVLFDNLSGRWFATILDVTTGTIHVAVSSSGSATSSWTVYVVGGSPAGFFPDQPILGVDSKVVALGGNVYNTSTSAFLRGEVWALNKSSMLTGSSTYWSYFYNSGWFSMHPVHSLSATSTEHIVMTSGSSTLKLFKLTGFPSNHTTVFLSGATSLAIHTFSTPPAAPQKGTSYLLDTSDTRVMDAVWRSNILWTTFDTGCKPSGDSVTRSCVRLVELKTTSTPSVAQDFNISRAKVYTFYGALALDGNMDLAVVYGYSNSTLHPILAVTGQLGNGTAGSLLATKVLFGGAASVTVGCNILSVCRWGDYYGAGADPRSPNLWVAGEIVPTSLYWATWISSVRL
ncbi:MAG: hypothetical protein L3K07_05080 [Thermoplasmata archaeon]|nr:hypothetical protein [Thermoplasmata archaeon]